ncbi:unnamed protein product, partial [Prorocentrum cordatum]
GEGDARRRPPTHPPPGLHPGMRSWGRTAPLPDLRDARLGPQAEFSPRGQHISGSGAPRPRRTAAPGTSGLGLESPPAAHGDERRLVGARRPRCGGGRPGLGGRGEQQPMFAPGTSRKPRVSAPEVGRLKSNTGLRPSRPPWLLAAGAAAVLALVALAAVAAAKAGPAPESSQTRASRRTEVVVSHPVVGHPPEHMRTRGTQAPTPSPGVKHPLNIGNVLGSPLVVPPAGPARGLDAGAVEASLGQRPARLTIGHPPERTQTLAPRADAAAP